MSGAAGGPARRPGRGFTAALADQADPRIGQEVILVGHDDGRVEQLHLHDYARLYSLPGVYEQIVHERLGCRSPARLAAMLGEAVDELSADPASGWRGRAAVRVLDIAAGNGVSGEALAAEGLGGSGRYGTDIVPEAREAALRDRPEVYADYLTLDLLALDRRRARQLTALGCHALTCVAPVGDAAEGQVPPGALRAAVGLLADDALVVYMHDPNVGVPDVVTPDLWAHQARATLLARRRYVHRQTVNGRPYEMEGVVWRVRRPEAQ